MHFLHRSVLCWLKFLIFNAKHKTNQPLRNVQLDEGLSSIFEFFCFIQRITNCLASIFKPTHVSNLPCTRLICILFIGSLSHSLCASCNVFLHFTYVYSICNMVLIFYNRKNHAHKCALICRLNVVITFQDIAFETWWNPLEIFKWNLNGVEYTLYSFRFTHTMRCWDANHS